MRSTGSCLPNDRMQGRSLVNVAEIPAPDGGTAAANVPRSRDRVHRPDAGDGIRAEAAGSVYALHRETSPHGDHRMALCSSPCDAIRHSGRRQGRRRRNRPLRENRQLRGTAGQPRHRADATLVSTERLCGCTRTRLNFMETNTNTPEAKQPASAGCIPRLVRPLSSSGEADCPKCHGHGSVARHNADWTCHRCGFHELVDPDRECDHKYAAAGLNTGRCIKCDAVKHFQTNREL